MTNNTIPNVPRQLLADLLGNDHDKRIMAERHLLAMLANAPSPAGVDGLKRYEVFPYLDDEVAELDICESDDGTFVKYEDAKAIIDGLRGEVERLQRAEKNDAIAYKAALERQDELRAELAAIKALEPVAWRVTGTNAKHRHPHIAIEFTEVLAEGQAAHWRNRGCTTEVTALYAAPVSEAKAQGVVQWPNADEIMQMAFEEGQPADDASGYCFELEEFDLFIERLMSDVARLNAAPVQQPKCKTCDDNGRIGGPSFYAPDEGGEPCPDCSAPVHQVSVPAWMASSRAFADRLYMAGWRDHADAQHSGVAGMYDELLSSAPAAPAADAWIPVSERLPDVPDGDEREVIVCVKRAHNGQSYSFSARYLNNFPLHSDSEDEPTFVTGWHDVKEHAEYDGWYSPLIDSSSGDEVTHWMPLPAAHRAKGVV